MVLPQGRRLNWITGSLLSGGLALRQEKTGWPFLSDTHSPEDRVTLGASWSACA